MTRNFIQLATTLFATTTVAAVTATGCTGQVLPIGTEQTDGGSSSSSSGAGSSGSSGGSSGSTSSGSSSSSGGASSGSASSSGSSSSSGSGGSSSGGGASCCPAGFMLYRCTFEDGGAGLACHNPALGCASTTTCGQGCDPVVTGACGGGSSSSSSSGGGGSLHWFRTCGGTVGCPPAGDGGITDDAGAPCPAIGTSCTTQGALCGTSGPYACPQGVICADQPPTVCPISSRRFKDGVTYVDDPERQRLHDETLGLRLATYHYKPTIADPNPRHLGFIIEDTPRESPAVDGSRTQVDIYGYLSMVVATMQVQEKEIAALRQELDEARRGACDERPTTRR